MDRRRITQVTAAVLIAGMCAIPAPAEPLPSPNAAARLIELGYLSQEYTVETYAAAIRDFRKGNNLPEADTMDDAALAVLMSENARAQSEYLAGKAQAMREWNTLSIGAYGEKVIHLQTSLAMYGYFDGACNGAYNELTEQAVRRFQLACGLNITGIADKSLFLRLYESEPKTFDEFLRGMCCKENDSGDNVRTLQVWLKLMKRNGFTETGSFGAMTERAVRRYQQSVGIPVTGEADPDTIRMLVRDVLAGTEQTDSVKNYVDIDSGELIQLLTDAGYDAGETLDMQTQLALMKYQKSRGLSPTGIVDHETVEQLRMGAIPVSDDQPAGNPDYAYIAQTAYDMIGKRCVYTSTYGFPEFVYLKCGSELPNEQNARTEKLTAAEEAQPGETVFVSDNGIEYWGISCGRGGVICMEDGIVLLHYPAAEEGTEVFRVIM